jgi:hypothetical protein
MWLHHELIPFFYSQSVQAGLREGQLMHPGPRKDEYLLGDTLLVGVMTDERPERDIVFSPGTWLDYWNNHVKYDGGQTAHVSVPEERSPVYVKVGAILPLNVENGLVGHGDAASKGWRTLDIYPGLAATRVAVWDKASFPPRAGIDRTEVVCEPADAGFRVSLAGGTQKHDPADLESQAGGSGRDPKVVLALRRGRRTPVGPPAPGTRHEDRGAPREVALQVLCFQSAFIRVHLVANLLFRAVTMKPDTALLRLHRRRIPDLHDP